MDTRIIKIIFVGGLDNRKGDLNLQKQTELVKKGYGDNVKSFRYNTTTNIILTEIENNPDSPILLFSAGCAKSKEIATKLKSLNRKLDLLHIVEPYTCSDNTKNIVKSAIELGVPSSNVFKGTSDCTGANITGATSNKELGKEIGINNPSHWDAVKIVSSFIKSKFLKEEVKEEVKEKEKEEEKKEEKKELKTYELTLKIDENGKITNDKLGTLKIIEKIQDSILSGFDFGDEDDLSDLLLEDEFREDIFSGNEASFNEIIDEPPGPSPDEDLPGSPVSIPELDPNSKFLAKVGTNYYIVDSSNGLAGKRLRKIVTELESYLKKHYDKGCEIKSNGVMRDLRGSTYPNSPKRAIASFHGAGLAIDLKFVIPGKKWSGIGDNKNLANDTRLNKVMYAYTKTQSDVTWGGQWGEKEGTKVKDGIIKGWGVVEYHHFELKATVIVDYWKPFKDDIAKLGIDINKLNKVGKGSELEKLNKLLLASVGQLS